MKSYDVIIIGRGLTALSTAWHLNQLGITRVALVAPDRRLDNCASLNIQCATSTLYENITRPVHNYGPEIARELLRLSRCGFSQLMTHLARWKIKHAVGHVRRLSLSAMETREMEQAMVWLSDNGFPAHREKITVATRNCDSIQVDGATSVSFDVNTLLRRLEENSTANIVNSSVQRIEKYGDKLKIQTICGQEYDSELVVGACHMAIKRLIPDLSSILVNHSDQLMEFDILSHKSFTKPGDMLIAGHGQYWLYHTFENKLVAGGARFLRQWGGVEAESASVLKQVSETVQKKIEALISIKLSAPRKSHGLIEIYTCDELPLIGPLFGNSRILVASGYMNSGVSFGLAAGCGLAEFIATGQSRTVSKTFLPSRLRSLPESQ